MDQNQTVPHTKLTAKDLVYEAVKTNPLYSEGLEVYRSLWPKSGYSAEDTAHEVGFIQAYIYLKTEIQNTRTALAESERLRMTHAELTH